MKEKLLNIATVAPIYIIKETGSDKVLFWYQRPKKYKFLLADY